MAKETLVLTPYGLGGSGIMMFQFSYYDSKKRKQLSLLTNGTIYEGALAFGKDAASQRQEKKVFFDAKNTRYVLEYDPQDKSSMEHQEAKFILNHPNVENKSGKQSDNYSGKPIWSVELIQQKIEGSYNFMVKRLNVANQLLALNPLDWRECAFRFGINPTGKGPHEVASMLVDQVNGAVLKSDQTCDEFIKWKNDYNKDDPKYVAEKAILLSIIKRDNETYKIDGNPIGRTVDEVSAALSSDRTTLRQVISDIEKNDNDLASYIEMVEEFFPEKEDGQIHSIAEETTSSNPITSAMKKSGSKKTSVTV